MAGGSNAPPAAVVDVDNPQAGLQAGSSWTTEICSPAKVHAVFFESDHESLQASSVSPYEDLTYRVFWFFFAQIWSVKIIWKIFGTPYTGDNGNAMFP